MKRLSLVVLGALGCADGRSEAPRLVLELDRSTSVAGQPVGWQAWRAVDGHRSEAVSVGLLTDLEPSLPYSGHALYPRQAGLHEVVAVALVDGERWVAQAQLEVRPGPAAVLDVVLEADALSAGQPTGWLAQAEDAFGNDVSVVDLVVLAEPPVEVLGETIQCSAAGRWSVTAVLDSAQHTVSFEVTSGPAASLELQVEALDHSVVTQAVVEDAYGNPVDAEVALSVEGVAHSVVGPVVYFQEEGWATLIATTATAEGVLEDRVGPLAIDRSAPELALESPVRGVWLDEGPSTFVGTAVDAVVGLQRLRYNGAVVDVDADGAWSHPVELAHGLQIHELLATDESGHLARVLRATVAGDTRLLGTSDPDGVRVRLDEGSAGLGAIEAVAVTELSTAALEDEVDDPVYSDRTRACQTELGVTICLTTELAVTLTDIRYDSAAVVLDGQADGQLDGTLVLDDITVDWTATGELSEAPLADSGEGTADRLVMDFQLSFAVVDGVVDVTVSDVSVALVDFGLGASGDVSAAEAVLGADLDASVGAAVEDAVADVIPSVLEQAVERGLHDLNLDLGWPQGTTLTARPLDVVVDEAGLTVPFSAVADLDEWALDRPASGGLVTALTPPAWDHAHPAAMALSLNTLNHLFHANWGAGIIQATGGPEIFQIDPAVFGAALPGIDTLVGTLDATYPPFFVADGSGGLRMELPELRMDLYNRQIVPESRVYSFYLTVSTPVEVALKANRLDLVWGSPDVWLDLVEAPPDADRLFLELMLESFSAGLVLADYELVEALPLPTIGGLQLQGDTVTLQGPEGGFVVVGGGFDAP